ncbi:MAG TPA: lytic transglycosylase domain-containing protein [Nannocystaceae bacterium]|nr:lytic transglycosylase domain-containing protein [Nannocystaceae bacterium]
MLLAACRRETPPVALEVGEHASEGEAKSEAQDDPAMVVDARALWWKSGAGRDAILARERGDHATAIAKLDELLADSSLSADDRGAAQLLRALEHEREGKFTEAAALLNEAASAPALAPIASRMRLLQAQALLDASDPKAALACVVDLRPETLAGSPLVDDLLVVRADAMLRDDDVDGARAAYRAYLKDHAGGPRKHECAVKLARSLARSEAAADLVQAVDLYEELALAVPLSDYGEEAERELPGLRKKIAGAKTGAALRDWERKVTLARIDAMVDRGRYKPAIRAIDQLLGGKGLAPLDRCQALFAKGTAVFKQRERAKSRVHFEQAMKDCDKAGKPGRDFAVKAGYQAARGRYAEGKHAVAAAEFEKLAKTFADHSYADDAWVLAGESWESAGEADKARTAWRAALDTEGDMMEEARRRLLVAAFARGDDADALALADGGLSGRSLLPAERGKLHYFRGRALGRLGKKDEAKAAWLEVLAVGPMDYPSLQALSRLRELGDDALAQGLDALGVGTEPSEATAAAPTKESAAATIYAKLGLGEWAQDELRAASVGGWTAVAVLNQAGLYSGAQKLIASLGSSWRTRPPIADARAQWEQAHPRPVFELIAPREPKHGVPPWLTYAIMQTESRFDPSATSWAGARGLIQLMPSTAKSVATQAGVTLDGDEALYDPETNIDLGMHHLGRLVARFGNGDGAVALAIPSYNAGVGAVERWLDERKDWELDVFVEGIPYDETRKYTQSVLGRWLAYRVLYGTADERADRIPYLALPLPKRGS